MVTNVAQLGGGSGLTLRAASAFDRTTRLYLTYELALAVGVGAVAVTYLLLRRRLGLALTAIRDGEQSAQSLGVPVFRTKFVVYLVAAFGCSLAGACGAWSPTAPAGACSPSSGDSRSAR
jgi:branched-chain amino acid transport system permease protein